MNGKRAVLPAVGDKDEGYDERAGIGTRFVFRRNGWSKAPFGHGHVCPECRATVSEWHKAGAHDDWHRHLNEDFGTLDNARDEDRALIDQLHGELAETRAALEEMRGQLHNFAVILGAERASA